MNTAAIDGFRRADARDAAAIARLVRRAYARWAPLIGREARPLKADYAQDLRSLAVWVVDGKNDPAAVLELLDGGDHLLVENVAVDPALQGFGLGRRLMAFAEAEARRMGVAEVRLFTDGRFADNLSFYDRLGYSVFDRVQHGDAMLVFMSKTVGQTSRLST